MRIKTKRHKHSTAYYSNSTFKFTFNIIFHVNPQPVSNATKCSACEKTVKCNQKRVICDKKSFDVTHGKCSNSQTFVLNSRVPCYWTCNKCLHTDLPFFKSSFLENDICNLDTSEQPSETPLIN